MAQQGTSFTGTVLDENGEPVVRPSSQSSGPALTGTVLDENGEPVKTGSDKPKSRGASGSWQEPDIAQKFQTEHPYLAAPPVALARFGKGVTDAVTGTVKGIYGAFTEPPKPGEEIYAGKMGQVGLGLGRLLVQPQIEQFQKARQAPTTSEAVGHTVAGALPFVGPFTAGMTEQVASGELPVPEALGQITGGYLIGRAIPELMPELNIGRPAKATPVTEQAISATSTMIKSGIKDDLVNAYAEQTIPIWRQAAAELGKTPRQFPRRSTTTNTLVGIQTEASKRRVRTGGEHALEIADHAVDIANRPFEEVLYKHGKASIERAGVPAHLTVKGKILANLDRAAAENSNNPALASAIKDLRSRVEQAQNFNDLQSLKVLSNKKAAGIFDRSLGAQINASADASYSWKVLGDSIRAEMYPELSSLSGVDLSNAGRLEAVVMDSRDGLRKHFFKDVMNPHNKRMQQTYWDYVKEGGTRTGGLTERALMLISRAASPGAAPAGEFNRVFMRGMGEIPPMPKSVPYTPGQYNFVPKPITGVAQDLIPHETTGMIGPQTVPPVERVQMSLFEPPPAVSRETGEAIFRAQQRAQQEARRAPPPTLTGTQIPIAERATPASPPAQPFAQPGAFYPGKSGVEGATDYSQQGQLFSIRQTPVRFNPIARETYTMQDLRSMAQEISNWVQNNQNHPQRLELMRDLEAVKSEIYRRAEAHKTPKSKRE